jgi:hypothetical protein
MSVIHEYFVLDNDDQAAGLIGSYGDGVLGVEAVCELASLEALLLGRSPVQEAVLELMSRPDHALTVAVDDPAAAEVVVSKVADHTTALIANADPEHVAAAMQSWSQTDEFSGYVSAADLTRMMQALLPLFKQAANQGQHVYVRTSC